MSTPLATDQFSRFMVEMFDEKKIIKGSSLFQTFFGRPEHASQTVFSPNANSVEIDIMRGNERLAALVHRGTDSRPLGGNQKNTDTQKFTNQVRQYPLGEEEGDITAAQIIKRVAGENPFQQKDRLDRMRILANEHHLEHMRRYSRLFEFLASESLLKGTMPAILGTTNSDLIYDFKRRATHIVTVGTKWDNSADIMGDADDSCRLIRADGKVKPNFMILGGDSMDALIKDTTMAALADNRRFELFNVGTGLTVPSNLQPLVDAGAEPRGRLLTSKGYSLWIFTYVDLYTNSSGVTTDYMPQDQALIGYFGARCDRYFGPPDRLPVTSQEVAWYNEMFGFNMLAPPMAPNVKNAGAVINPGMFYSDAYPSEDKKKVTIRTQAAPIFATTMTDAFVTLKGLV